MRPLPRGRFVSRHHSEDRPMRTKVTAFADGRPNLVEQLPDPTR